MKGLFTDCYIGYIGRSTAGGHRNCLRDTRVVPNVGLKLRNFLIASCLLPLSIGSSAIAQQPTTLTLTQSPNSTPTNPRTSQLVGQWRLKDYLPIPLTVIFTQDGKLFVLLPSYISSFISAFLSVLSSGSSSADTASFAPGFVVAYEYRYKIDSATQPMQIDVISPAENQTLATIFEFTPDGQLRVEWEGLSPGETRPTEFTAGAIFMQRVSNTTALPRNTQIVDLAEQQRQKRQSEGEQSINSLNSAQEAFYIENQKFAAALDELGTDIKPETENYRFQIVPHKGLIPSTMVTATAKSPDLKSYTGAVFVIKLNNEESTVSVVCGTDKPSTTPPAMPTAPKDAQEEIQCPAGSSRSGL